MVSKYSNRKTPEEHREFWFLPDGRKRCCTCQEFKPLTDYHKDSGGIEGVAYSCKVCANARSKLHHARRMRDDPKYRRAMKERYVRQSYGLSRDEYEALLLAQDYICPICQTRSPKGGWHLDHNHTTGKVRQFLCNPCNRGLGYLQDSTEVLQAAMNYLRRHNESI